MSKHPEGAKDHYVPQFYLKRWSGEGKLATARILEQTGKLNWNHFAPKGTAYERGLYGDIEEQFFKSLDNDSCNVLTDLESNGFKKNRKLEIGNTNHALWAQYL